MENKRTDRECFLDRLRVAATCAVVLLHTITGVMDTTDMGAYPLEKRVFLGAMDLITWCVPAFLLISGYLFLNPDRKITFSRMAGKYCRRIVLALLCFGAPYAFLELLVQERAFHPQLLLKSIGMVLAGKTWSHMWYLYLILFLYLLTPAIKVLLARLPRAALYGILAILFLSSSLMPFLGKLMEQGILPGLVSGQLLEGDAGFWPSLPDGGIYLFYYLCGYLFLEKESDAGEGSFPERAFAERAANEWASAKKVSVGRRRLLLFLSVAALAGGMLTARLAGNYQLQMAYNYPFTVILSLLLMRLFQEYGRKEKEEKENQTKKIKTKKHSIPWEGLGSLCFAVYLVHPVFVNLLYKFLQVTPLAFTGRIQILGGSIPGIVLSLPLFFLVILLLSLLTAWVLWKIPLLRRYVL